ncbi:MAG: hypothetical protein Q7J65_02110 [Candidatus Marinimicrobia bacterium]|nr:hypothetical protein [Candidatus Neomarinimicrobiota bacterium]
MDAHNANEEPDIKRFASIAGIDLETAHSLAEQLMGKINKIRSKTRKKR